MWLAATARATLPHTSVDATTMGPRECARPPVPQPVSAANPTAKTSAADSLTSPIRAVRTLVFLSAGPPTDHNTNDNRFH
jgi:hypothetical protein